MARPRTVRERLLWEYAKLIATSAKGEPPSDRKSTRRDAYWRFTEYTYARLLREKIRPSALLRENKLLVATGHQCAYCASEDKLEWEHLIPLSRGGPNEIDNLVLACKPCNLQKGPRDPIAWYGPERRREIPRLVMGKLLKLLLSAHASAGTLDNTEYPTGHGLHLPQLMAIFTESA